MAATLTDDEVGKTVVDAEQKELGIVAKVEDGRAYVDPNPSVAEHVMAAVGWEGEDEEDYLVTEDMIASVGDEIVLQGDL
ncbi:hypothetical protein C483_06205 [Natrialba hulunbeirensis JCM 10989]|uniref:PRC-barrel domain-containing protein n=1 Tax=Natrialba hulunbeirensis JCM 10989 TaxID=1227493 RepID=M0A6E3_9EURY|nr:hypothetical protein [Natrialba hulunbeirensis]ELY92903.1 hypothetical protein C483_06205 [Natrialba hulunbeirensis JCM 10989]